MPAKIKTKAKKTRPTRPKSDGWLMALLLTAFIGLIAVGLVSLGVITRNVEDLNRGKGPEATLAPKMP